MVCVRTAGCRKRSEKYAKSNQRIWLFTRRAILDCKGLMFSAEALRWGCEQYEKLHKHPVHWSMRFQKNRSGRSAAFQFFLHRESQNDLEFWARRTESDQWNRRSSCNPGLRHIFWKSKISSFEWAIVEISKPSSREAGIFSLFDWNYENYTFSDTVASLMELYRKYFINLRDRKCS